MAIVGEYKSPLQGCHHLRGLVDTVPLCVGPSKGKRMLELSTISGKNGLKFAKG